MKYIKLMISVVVSVLFVAIISYAGLQDRSSWIELKPNPDNYIRMPELSAAPATPVSGWGKVYAIGNDIFFKDDAGVATSMIGAALGVGNTLDEAYDQGGAGAGATINADSGPVIVAGSGADIALQGTHSGSGNVIDLINAGTGKDIDGTSSTWSVTKAGAAVFASIGGHTSTGNIDLDDGVTASPSLIFTDATDETATFSKADAGVLSLTTDATDGLNVLVGNLWVGNGAPGVAAMDGEDAYVEGQLEVDGTVQLDGAVTMASTLGVTGVITLENGLTIDNAVNNSLEWNENSEEIKWVFAPNDLGLVSTSGVVELSLFDDAADVILSHSANGAADDFYINQTGAQDASLIISSTGTGADALQLITTAGGIDITATGAATEDIDITAATSSINLSASEADAAAVTIAAPAGGIDITSAATFDIDVTATGGTVKVIASEAAADQFKVDAQGTVVGDAITLETTDGGIMLNADGATEGDIEANAAGSIIITAAEAVATAVTILAPAGGIDLTSAATFDIDLTATGGRVQVSATEAAADQFKVAASGVVVGDAINLVTTDGGIILNADGAANGDIEVNAADALALTAASTLTVSGSFVYGGVQDIAAGGTTTVAVLTNQVFTVGADAGGDIVTLANGTAGQIVYFICEDEAGTTTITPATFNGGTSITFNALGDTVTLIYTTGTGWSIVGGNSYSII